MLGNPIIIFFNLKKNLFLEGDNCKILMSVLFICLFIERLHIYICMLAYLSDRIPLVVSSFLFLLSFSLLLFREALTEFLLERFGIAVFF